MAEVFVTLFDSKFLPQGMALHQSLQKHCQCFQLWIICIDEKSYDILTSLALPNVNILSLATLESVKHKEVKLERLTLSIAGASAHGLYNGSSQ